MGLIMTNTLAYYGTYLIVTIKYFMLQAFGVNVKLSFFLILIDALAK